MASQEYEKYNGTGSSCTSKFWSKEKMSEPNQKKILIAKSLEIAKGEMNVEYEWIGLLDEMKKE